MTVRPYIEDGELRALAERLQLIGHHLTGCHEKDKARDVWEAARLIAAYEKRLDDAAEAHNAIADKLVKASAREKRLVAEERAKHLKVPA